MNSRRLLFEVVAVWEQALVVRGLVVNVLAPVGLDAVGREALEAVDECPAALIAANVYERYRVTGKKLYG